MARLGALAFLLAFIPLASSQWVHPTAERELWHVGETKKIQYHTKYTNYTIALWQQALAGGSADLGPVLFQTTTGPHDELDWVVQLYDFDLGSSNVFFFWMKEGGLENVGSTKIPTMSSAYFNITDEPLPSSSSAISSPISPSSSSSSSSSSSPSSSSSTSSTSALSSSSSSSDTAPASSASSALSTTSSTTSPAATNNSPTATGRAANQGEATAGSVPSESSGGGGLPVGAQAGIGVGVSIVGLTAIICGVLWFRYLRKQQRILEGLQQVANHPPPGATEAYKAQLSPGVVHYYPAYELGPPPKPPPQELGNPDPPRELGHY